MYSIVYTKAAVKDIQKLKSAHLEKEAKALIDIMRENPVKVPPACEKLQGNLNGLYSRRLNYQHRLVYQVDQEAKTVKIISMFNHYDD